MSYNSKEEVQRRVQEHYDWVVSKGYEVMGVFLQGSWNYSDLLCDEESDVDTKCWVLPTLEDLALNKKPVSFTHVFENGEHCDVKDFRLYVDCFKKQNVNFVEVLFTDYFVINPKYEDIVETLFENREAIAHYDNYATLNCMVGMIFQKQKALCHPYEGIKDKIQKYGYDGKQLSHAYRMYTMMNDYINGERYEFCLHINDVWAKIMMEVKRFKPDTDGKILTKEKAIDIMEDMTNIAVSKKRYYMEHVEHKINKNVDELFNAVLIESIYRGID